MKTLTLFILMLSCTWLYAQKIDSAGYLSNIKGKGLCIRKGTEVNLKIPFFFLNGDIVKMVNGNAILVLFTEEEVKLNSGESYTITLNDNAKSKNKDISFTRTTKQSNCSFKIRGLGDPQITVFPNYSKVVDISKAFIQIKSKNKENNKYFFSLTRADNGETVYYLQDNNQEIIDLKPAHIEKGFDYSWKIKYPEYEAFGRIKVLTDDQIKQIPVFELNNRASYAKAFNYYFNNDCYFEAFQIIEEAIKAYPEDEYYYHLRSLMF